MDNNAVTIVFVVMKLFLIKKKTSFVGTPDKKQFIFVLIYFFYRILTVKNTFCIKIYKNN